MATLDPKTARRIAGVELNALVLAGAYPGERLEEAEVAEAATPVYDINGEVLFYRIPVVHRERHAGAVDIAAHEVLGEPLLGYADGLEWKEDALLGEARHVAIKQRLEVAEGDELRFVAFSYPKIAVQFLRQGEEVVMLELFTWEPVPPQEGEHERMQPGNFERWSLIEEMDDELREQRARTYSERLEAIDALLSRVTRFDINEYLIRPRPWWDILDLRLFDRRELRYSLRTSHHTPCYELRGQQTSVWCVGASAQMLLDFYRYEYTQDRLAEELGLGTRTNPNGLPYSRVGDVVTALEALTSNALNVTMITNPGFSTFSNEIRANRPLISFVPGHSRTVVGYTQTLIPLLASKPSRGLLVYDPWPPNAGVITRWENFAAQTYQYAYTAGVNRL